MFGRKERVRMPDRFKDEVMTTDHAIDKLEEEEDTASIIKWAKNNEISRDEIVFSLNWILGFVLLEEELIRNAETRVETSEDVNDFDSSIESTFSVEERKEYIDNLAKRVRKHADYLVGLDDW